jgi:hypothetical protein
MSTGKPRIRPRKQNRFNSRSPLAWLLILVLICGNVIIFSILWNMVSSQGQTARAGPPPPTLLLPLAEPQSAPEPTATATHVVDYAPTATKTPTPLPTQTPTATNIPPPAPEVATPTAVPAQADISHVVIISIDGLRPDALDLTDTPTLDSLRARGAYSPRAQTISLSITLPSHASMLTGMTPDKHGILWGLPYIGWPGMNGPSLFSVAHDAGLSTAMVFGKEKLNYLVLPNSVDTLIGADVGDTEVKTRAVEVIEAGLPNVLFIHFPDIDRVGHNYGWLSTNQLQSVTFVDGLIGELVTALDRGGYQSSTLLIITADHGGHGNSHGDDSPEDRAIPWLAVGPGVRAGVILTTAINTYDTAATAAYALKLPLPENWDGQPVQEIFN